MDKNLVVDHVYHNTVDNRKSQLRIATRAQNSYNKNLLIIVKDNRCLFG